MNRNYQILTINQRLTCSAFELSTGQVLSLLFACSDLTMPDDEEKFSFRVADRILNDVDYVRFSGRKPKLTQAEATELIEGFTAVNRAFFNPKLGHEETLDLKNAQKSGRKTSLAKSYDSLCSEVEVYTRWGHPNLLNYPWSLFVTVRANFKEWSDKNG